MIRRIILIAASCPSNNEAAVTILTLLVGLYGSIFSMNILNLQSTNIQNCTRFGMNFVDILTTVFGFNQYV
jgi:hypothetical protein